MDWRRAVRAEQASDLDSGWIRSCVPDAVFEREVLYKITDDHSPAGSRVILWNDPEIAIDWPLPRELAQPVVSSKDRHGKLLIDAEAFP